MPGPKARQFGEDWPQVSPGLERIALTGYHHMGTYGVGYSPKILVGGRKNQSVAPTTQDEPEEVASEGRRNRVTKLRID